MRRTDVIPEAPIEVPDPPTPPPLTDQTSERLVYRPSGRVAWAQALPMAAASAVTACAMALVLYRVDRVVYVPLVSPCALAVPVILTIALAIHFGRCRSATLAGAFAAVIVALYYAGFWVVSFHQTIYRAGPNALLAMEQAVGVGGLTGYFVGRCQLMGMQTGWGTTPFVVLRALELGLIAGTALYVARKLSGRAYSETYDRWASSRAFCFKPADLPEVRAAIDRCEWWRLGAVEKVASTREQRVRGMLLCRVEYVPRCADQPVYVSVEGATLRRLTWLLAALPVLARMSSRLIVQRLVPPHQARELASHVGGIDLDAQAPDDAASESRIGYWTDPQANGRGAGEGAITCAIAEVGFAGVTLVGRGADFRAPAAVASQHALSSTVGVAPGDLDVSLCFPVDPDPVPKLKRASHLDLITSFAFPVGMLLGFAAHVVAVVALSYGQHRAAATLMAAAGVTAALGFVALLFNLLCSRRVQTWMLMRSFARRSPTLLEPRPALPKLPVRIEDPATFHVSKVTPEDWAICRVDAPRRRLLVEGISHRYVIRGQDVCAIEPLRSAAATVRIDLLVGGAQPLSLVVAEFSAAAVFVYALASLPLLALVLRGAAAGFGKRFARRLSVALRVGEV
jgi:hypothetical protein